MKGQETPSHRRLAEEKKIAAEGMGVSLIHSLNTEEADNTDSDYIQLRDLSEEVRPRATGVLSTLTALGISPEALGQAEGIRQPLQALLAKELSCSRYFRWAVVDNFVEKILQGLVLNKQDISQEDIHFCRSMIRQVPSGRSLLLHQTCGLRKMYAARGFVLTTEMVLTKAVKIFITVSLSYRLYDWVATGNKDFVEFRAIFDNNSAKGVSSLARLLLANFDPAWLYLLLTSPAIAGVLKGLWDTRRSEPLTESAITQLEETVNHHTNALFKKYYLWKDILRQMIPMPGFSSVSERVQKAEQQIRWDGRIIDVQRASLFSNIERLALQGSGMSKINAMQSLAKIVHSLSIKDFHQLQQAGYSQETLVQILRIKTQALRDLKMLSNRARLQPEEVEQSPATALQQSIVSTVYANYLLWWLGMGKFKYSPVFWSFKLGKLALEGLFINTLVESILDLIKCPNKKGFKMFFGTFERWADELTPDCFYEFVRQFRSIYKDEPFQPFLEQLSNFDFRAVESINLQYKDLTSNEIREILNVLNKRAFIETLNLGYNKINGTMGLLFPNSLQSLDLSFNNLGAEGAKGLQFPLSLKSLDLNFNNLGDEGAKGLQLPSMLQFLSLTDNNIGAEGAKGIQLPSMLRSLYLNGNKLGAEGAKGLQLPSMLQSLSLWNNNISAEGAKGLLLPLSLQSLDLGSNNIGDEGAKGLQLPSMLKSLNLYYNNIGNEGAKGLQLPALLESLQLNLNKVGDEGAKGLQLPSMLQFLSLYDNKIGDEGAKGLQLPALLQGFDLSYNYVGDEGAKGLQLPLSLRSLSLGSNKLSVEGVKGLRLPAMLRDLRLHNNNISAEGIKSLQFSLMLRTLGLDGNNIGDEGAKGLQLPASLTDLDLGSNNIGNEGVKGLRLPPSLQSLSLWSNNIGAEGAKGLQLPSMLQSLSLGRNNLGAEGAKGLQLPSMLQSLDLRNNNISDEGAKGLQLPSMLKSLDLQNNNLGAEGAKGLQLPSMLQVLELSYNNIGNEGTRGLQLPSLLQSLWLRNNNIGDEGIKALLQKIPKTKLTTIDLNGNQYNSPTINVNRIIQQRRLLENCQRQLCYANTLLEQQDGPQTSGAARVQPALFFSWLKKPFDKLSEYASDCISATLDSLGTRLEKVLSQSPSYFPNIHSPEINDWQPSGSVMLHQFKAGGSNVLLLSATQMSIQPSLRSIAR